MLKYSIVVPVYNVEPYLRECLDSILAQDSPSQYEVILVDDGSTDRSGVICDEYADRYEHFFVIHKENRGLGEARNSGLKAAKGEFVFFIDSDDLWKPELLSCMDGVVDQKADMTLFLYERFDESGSAAAEETPLMPEGESGEAYLQRLFKQGDMPIHSACMYMYSREFLIGNNLWFSKIPHSEDLEFCLRSLPIARSVLSARQALYCYRQRQGSMSNSTSKKKLMINIDLTEQWIKKYPNSALANFYCAWGLYFPEIGTKEEIRELVAHYAQNADILKLVSKPKMKIARFLYHVFGYYEGAKAYMWLVRVKHFINGNY